MPSQLFPCFLVVSLLSVACTGASAYTSWTPETFPDPQTDPARCGRAHVSKSWVCDPDGILPRKSGDVIEGTLKEIAAANEPYAEAKDCGSGRRSTLGYQARQLKTNKLVSRCFQDRQGLCLAR